jgi:uncharacterized protein YuzE
MSGDGGTMPGVTTGACMALNYDLDAQALYIRLCDGKVARTRQLDDNTLVDLDATGNVLGVEVVAIGYPWALAEVIQMDGITAGAKTQMLAYFAPPALTRPTVSFSV